MGKKAIHIILLLSIGFWSEAMPQERERIHWIDFEQLSDSLDVNPRPVLISFHTEWCAYCRKMHREVFTNPEIVKMVNEKYYAVHFDAESRDTILFDGQIFVNKEYAGNKKGFHEIARLLGDRNGRFNVPVTLILDENFAVRHRRFEYLSSKKLKAILD